MGVPRYDTEEDLSDPRLPLPQMIARRAADNPDRVFLEMVTGDSVTYGDFNESVLVWAGAFARLGIGRQNVATMLPASFDTYRAWLGLAWVGATEVPLNVGYRGSMLVHALTQCETSVLVTNAQLLGRVVEVAEALPHLHTVVLVDDLVGREAIGARFKLLSRAEFVGGVTVVAGLPGPAIMDPACIIYTSGTTGPSKGVVDAWPLLYLGGRRLFPSERMDADVAMYAPAPPYHLSGKLPPYVAAILGGRAVLRERMSLTEMWDDIIKFRCTVTIFSGMMAQHVMRSVPPSDTDRDVPLRHLLMASPVIPEYEEFANRFGVEIVTGFAMTEIGMFMTRSQEEMTADTYDSVGQPHPGYQARIVDDDDNEVPTGTVGELVVRSSVAGSLNLGYYGRPEATEVAWRDGWFHTGDGFRRDEPGNFYFVDRIKDCIRRRGENISSFEVETAVAQHPAVQDCAAVPVAHRDGGAFDEEVKVVVALRTGEELSPEDLIAFLAPRMPRFMVPRYVEFVEGALPKTDNMKTRKVELREDPLNERTWDREAAGIELSR
jgi:crotonobetaine/carnitine-CoA ligase